MDLSTGRGLQMKLSKEFNRNAEAKRSTVVESETWSEPHHISKYFCAAAARRKLQEVEKVVTVTIPAPQQTIVRRGALRFH
jgi:hypothetical protein